MGGERGRGILTLIISLFTSHGEFQNPGIIADRFSRLLSSASDHSSLSVPRSAREQLTRSLDAILALGLPSEALPGRMTELLAQWRGGNNGGRRRAVRLLGPPPTWARRPTCSLDPREHVTRCGVSWVSCMGGTMVGAVARSLEGGEGRPVARGSHVCFR